jgi:hypothetical protein
MELHPMIRHNDHASHLGAIRVAKVCRKLHRSIALISDFFSAAACCLRNVECRGISLWS